MPLKFECDRCKRIVALNERMIVTIAPVDPPDGSDGKAIYEEERCSKCAAEIQRFSNQYAVEA